MYPITAFQILIKCQCAMLSFERMIDVVNVTVLTPADVRSERVGSYSLVSMGTTSSDCSTLSVVHNLGLSSLI